MTNEQKERLKEIIDSLLNSNMGTTGELNYQEMMWFQETIHSLIDNMPSEGDGLRAMDFIENLQANCSALVCKGITRCANCEDFFRCDDDKEIIRKALGIEGKE